MNTKTALITGSYGGLGTCFVTIHAGKGGDLILVGRDQKKLEEQAESVKKQYGVEVHAGSGDGYSIYEFSRLQCEKGGEQCPRIP